MIKDLSEYPTVMSTSSCSLDLHRFLVSRSSAGESFGISRTALPLQLCPMRQTCPLTLCDILSQSYHAFYLITRSIRLVTNLRCSSVFEQNVLFQGQSRQAIFDVVIIFWKFAADICKNCIYLTRFLSQINRQNLFLVLHESSIENFKAVVALQFNANCVFLVSHV